MASEKLELRETPDYTTPKLLNNMIDINELETMLSPKAEFKASPTLKDKVIAEAKNMAMMDSEPVRTEDDNDTTDIPHIVRLKPKIRLIYIIGVAAVAACVLLGFILFSHDDTAPGTPQPSIAEVTPEKTIPQPSADTLYRDIADPAVTDVSALTAEPAHEQPLLAQQTAVTEAEELADEDADGDIVCYYIPMSGPKKKSKPKPEISTQMMDDCIARLSKQYGVKPLDFDCSDPQQTGRTEKAYDFPDEKGNMIMAQLAQVASIYVEQNEDLNYFYSRNQFIMQLQNGSPNSPVIDIWQAERTNGRVIIYRTHTIGFNLASSDCFLEYKDKNINMRGDIM